MQFLDNKPVLEVLARRLIGFEAVKVPLLDPAAEQEDATRVREMPVHAVVFHLLYDIRYFDLVLDELVGLALHHEIAAEFAGQHDYRSIEQAAFFEIEHELGK